MSKRCKHRWDNWRIVGDHAERSCVHIQECWTVQKMQVKEFQRIVLRVLNTRPPKYRKVGTPTEVAVLVKKGDWSKFHLTNELHVKVSK